MSKKGINTRMKNAGTQMKNVGEKILKEMPSDLRKCYYIPFSRAYVCICKQFKVTRLVGDDK